MTCRPPGEGGLFACLPGLHSGDLLVDKRALGLAMRTELEVSLAGAVLAEHRLILARYERGAALTMDQGLPLAPLLERAAVER